MHKLDDNLFVMAQQQGVNTQRCLRDHQWLQSYKSRASNEALQQCVQKANEVLISQTCNNAYKDKKEALISQTCP